MEELADSERQRADVAQLQVDLERQRADAAQAQVDELLARLRSRSVSLGESISQGEGSANEEDR